MLVIRGLEAGYSGGTVLSALDLEIETGEVHAVVGRNGVGKTTLVHTIAGLLTPRAGTISLCGKALAGLPPHRVARAGVAMVPQGRRIFASLTVAEHLRVCAGVRRPWQATWTIPLVLELLPQLAERSANRGSELSGGEQQMLAIARALLTQPRLLALDEPCEGLSLSVARRIRDLTATIAERGATVLLIEQDARNAALIANRISTLDRGSLAACRV